MRKHFKFIFMLTITFLCIFLFQNTVFSTDIYYMDDDVYEAQYPGNTDISECTFHITTYGGTYLDAGQMTSDDFVYNETMGWYEYEYNGNMYVVLAGATKYIIGYYIGDPFNAYAEFKNYIHYFKYGDTISFKLDGEVYNGIILDSCGASMMVARAKTQILDIYCYDNVHQTGTGGKLAQLDGSTIEVTDTGIFSSGTSSSTAKRKYNFKYINIIGSISRRHDNENVMCYRNRCKDI